MREPVLVISDEPYRPLTYDGVAPPETPRLIERAVLAWSWSKAMAIAGERIGYLAISPRLAEAARAAQRLHVRQPDPGLHQRAGHLAVGGGARFRTRRWMSRQYQAKRDLLCDALSAMGYDAPRPQGSFYVFPRTPIADDVAFIRLLQEEGILAVPGTGFGRARLHAAIADHSARGTSSARCRGSSGRSASAAWDGARSATSRPRRCGVDEARTLFIRPIVSPMGGVYRIRM